MFPNDLESEPLHLACFDPLMGERDNLIPFRAKLRHQLQAL
jgi:hypothetical protein